MASSKNDIRKRFLQRVLELPKCFFTPRDHHYFHEVKGRVTILQSFVRGEIARRQYEVLKGRHGLRNVEGQLSAILQIQSVVRGWLTRRQFSRLQSSRNSGDDRSVGKKLVEIKDPPQAVLPSVVEELQRRVLMAKSTLNQKEKENAALREQLQQFEARWAEYEAKMLSVEEMLQSQVPSLQMSLAAAKTSLAADLFPGQAGRPDGSHSPGYYDSDTTSLGTHTPGGGTPIKYANNGSDAGAGHEVNGGSNTVNNLAREFEQRKRLFGDEANAIIDVKSGQSSFNPVEELRRLKHRFETWKKDYKVRLKEARAKLHKLGYVEGDKGLLKWWGKKSRRR